MKRSILTSLLVIGVAITIVAGGSTFSAFTDSSTGVEDGGGTGVSGADLELLVDGNATFVGDVSDGLGQAAGFTFALTGCNLDALIPGDVCTQLLDIRNTGEISFTYVVDAWSDVDSTDDGTLGAAGDTPYVDCFNVLVDADGGAAPASGAVGDVSSGSDAPTTYPDSEGDATDLAPTETDAVRVSISVDDAPECQTATAFIVVTVVATQSATAFN